jgi:hypothetical protein
MGPGRFCRGAEGVTVNESMVTSVQYASRREVISRMHRSDDTDAFSNSAKLVRVIPLWTPIFTNRCTTHGHSMTPASPDPADIDQC